MASVDGISILFSKKEFNMQMPLYSNEAMIAIDAIQPVLFTESKILQTAYLSKYVCLHVDQMELLFYISTEPQT